MNKFILLICIATFSLAGCGGGSDKAVPPKGPMTPPPAGSEGEGGTGGGSKPKNNTVSEG